MAAPTKRPLNPPTGNPLERTPYSPTTPVSQRTYPIAGIATTVLGLDELPKGCQNVSVIYLLHPRLQRAETMLPLGTLLVNSWNTRRAHLPPGHPSAELGLLCVTFDQRNHGGRLVNEVANGSWRDGNPRHAQDMYSSYAGTAADVSLLIDHLGSYVFEDFESHRYPEIVENYALGISLGGHACWHLLMREPRVRGAVVGIGCPDYIRVMTDRARLSKRPSYTSTTPPGRTFLGSPDFPPSLIAAVQAHDPVGILFGTGPVASPSNQSETARLRQVLDATLRGKHILKCSGGSDKLVPYAAARPFMDFLTEATRPGGWWEGGVSIDDRIYEGVAHEFTGEMVEDSVNWLVGLLEKQGVEGGKGRRDSNL